MTRLKMILAGVAALVAAVWGIMSRRSPWRSRARQTQGEATAAGHEAVTAIADKDKAEVVHDAKDAAVGVAVQSDSDLYDEALDKLGIKRPGD